MLLYDSLNFVRKGFILLHGFSLLKFVWGGIYVASLFLFFL
jgi:hypothetical protein